MVSLFKLSIFLDSVLVGCMFLESFSFLLGGQIGWHVIAHSILLYIFLFLECELRFFLFQSFFFQRGREVLSLFFLVKLIRGLLILFTVSKFGKSDQRFVNLVNCFKEPALGFIDFFLLFLNLSY